MLIMTFRLLYCWSSSGDEVNGCVSLLEAPWLAAIGAFRSSLLLRLCDVDS